MILTKEVSKWSTPQFQVPQLFPVYLKGSIGSVFLFRLMLLWLNILQTSRKQLTQWTFLQGQLLMYGGAGTLSPDHRL